MTQTRTKLLFFIAVDWFFCSHFLSRAKAAREAGYDVVVLTHVGSHGRQIEAAGLRLIPLQMSRRSMNPIAAVQTLLRIVRIYRREQPELVHQVALKPILLGSIAARLASVPHQVNAVVGAGYFFTSQRLLIRIMRPILRLALRLLLNPRGSRVVFENIDDLKVCVRARQVRQEDAVLIRGAGVEPERYYEGARIGTDPCVVLVARLLWDKGIGEFVKAANILLARGILARFVIVGDRDLDNRACIDSDTLEKWRKDGAVELWGLRRDIPEVLAQASIACLPSYREGLPKFLLEAMAASLPCVATDVPGCREVVRDGDNGLLVPIYNVQALADALEKLLLDPNLCRQMGRRGRQRLEQEFSSSLIIKKTMMLYQKVLSE